jgi:hypothetical protein
MESPAPLNPARKRLITVLRDEIAQPEQQALRLPLPGDENSAKTLTDIQRFCRKGARRASTYVGGFRVYPSLCNSCYCAAVTMISTKMSGRHKEACTQKRTGGFFLSTQSFQTEL